jgi:hypothetical protein
MMPDKSPAGVQVLNLTCRSSSNADAQRAGAKMALKNAVSKLPQLIVSLKRLNDASCGGHQKTRVCNFVLLNLCFSVSKKQCLGIDVNKTLRTVSNPQSLALISHHRRGRYRAHHPAMKNRRPIGIGG